MSARLGRCLVVVTLACTLRVSWAAPSADARYKDARAAAAEHRYEAALAAIRDAYDIDPRAEYLFAWAQIARLAGDCAQAVPIYDRFLATNPSPDQVDAATIARGRCVASLPTRPPPEPSPPPAVVVAPPPRIEPPTRASWPGHALLGTAAVAAVAGTAFLISAQHHAGAAGDPAGYDAYLDDAETARQHRVIGAISLVGAGLLGAGWAVLHFGVDDDGRRVALVGARWNVP